jgi:hypothetical protein
VGLDTCAQRCWDISAYPYTGVIWDMQLCVLKHDLMDMDILRCIKFAALPTQCMMGGLKHAYIQKGTHLTVGTRGMASTVSQLCITVLWGSYIWELNSGHCSVHAPRLVVRDAAAVPVFKRPVSSRGGRYRTPQNCTRWQLSTTGWMVGQQCLQATSERRFCVRAYASLRVGMRQTRSQVSC